MKKFEMAKETKIALLASPYNPFSMNLISWLRDKKTTFDAVIFDIREPDPRAAEIWTERTGGRMPLLPLETVIPPHVPAYFVDNHNSSVSLELLEKLDIGLAVNAGTPRIIGTHILNTLKTGLINVHPGLLPEYRGCTCVEWSIYNDDPVGNTAHFMTEGIDEGPIICRESYQFQRDASYQDIRLKVYQGGFELMGKAISLVLDNNWTAETAPKPNSIGTYYKPIPEDKYRSMLEKLRAGKYRWQK